MNFFVTTHSKHRHFGDVSARASVAKAVLSDSLNAANWKAIAGAIRTAMGADNSSTASTGSCTHRNTAIAISTYRPRGSTAHLRIVEPAAIT